MRNIIKSASTNARSVRFAQLNAFARTIPASRPRGSALIVVLAFLVLMTGVLVVFVDRALTSVKSSNSSTAETKSGLLAKSATEIIIGDLKQEIIAGSTQPPYSTPQWPVYVPNVPWTMVPHQSGVPISGTPIPNLISRSVSPANTNPAASPYVSYPTDFNGQTMYAAQTVPPNRAASDPTATNTTGSKVSSTTPSLNGRLITNALWNSHYLVPRDPAVTSRTNPDSTPVTSFVAPDWVVVTRSGATSISWSSQLAGSLRDDTASNANYAIGRYAFAVYNEGGLLDMNVAGYPGDPKGPGGLNGLTPAQSGTKASLALADLTQLPAGSSSPDHLSQKMVNQIVAWRNYATTNSPTGSFLNYTFDASTATNWLKNFAQSNPTSFLQVVTPIGQPTPPTDQSFVSRQQLIDLTRSLEISPDFLQYMGTFSRALDQPSYYGDSHRPTIIYTSAALTPPVLQMDGNGNIYPSSPNAADYVGNNTCANQDNPALPADQNINPPFLSERVTKAFQRLDGSAAVVGEPLIKSRFPLSSLGLIQLASKNQGSACPGDPIYDRFGLYRSDVSAPWTYNHGGVSQSGAVYILRLSEVAALTVPREPDFAELLKAAIIAGSLGKAAPNITSVHAPGSHNFQATLDCNLDFQILQIMANVIDQYDSDSFPTNIQISTNGTTFFTFHGIEDIPYFYQYHLFNVVDQAPIPLLNYKDTKVFAGGTLSKDITFDYCTDEDGNIVSQQHTSPDIPLTLPVTIDGSQGPTPGKPANFNPGYAATMIVPALWNPHDTNTTSRSTSLRPKQYRVIVSTSDPFQNLSSFWQIRSHNAFAGSVNGSHPDPSDPSKPYIPDSWDLTHIIPFQTGVSPNFYNVTPASTLAYIPPPKSLTNSSLQFSDDDGLLFREPTLLWNNSPKGLNLAVDNASSVAGDLTPVGSAYNQKSGSVPGVGWGYVVDAVTLVHYYGLVVGHSFVSILANVQNHFVAPPGTPQPPDATNNGYYIWQSDRVNLNPNEYASDNIGYFYQFTMFLQYLDSASNWVTYDTKISDFHDLTSSHMIMNTTDYPNYQDPSHTDYNFHCRLSDYGSVVDPRTGRWGVAIQDGYKTSLWLGTNGNGADRQDVPFMLDKQAEASFSGSFQMNAGSAAKMASFSVISTMRPGGDKGHVVQYSAAGDASNGHDDQFHLGTELSFYAPGSTKPPSPQNFQGMYSQNNPAIRFYDASNAGVNSDIYTEDADAVARRAMGAYAPTDLKDSSAFPYNRLASAQSPDPTRVGLPMATANTFLNDGVATPTTQSQSRPMILNRPFNSVGELSYAFRGTPWKNIDFFTPESGDTALLDVFCIDAPPNSKTISDGVYAETHPQMPSPSTASQNVNPSYPLISGKIDLNTRQVPVLQAIIAGAYKDEFSDPSSVVTYSMPPTLPALSPSEASIAASRLQKITSDTSTQWRGPLINVADIVGHFVYPSVNGPNGPITNDPLGLNDLYTYNPRQVAKQNVPAVVNYAGFSQVLDDSVFAGTNLLISQSSPRIQRFRESIIRPLAEIGQTRVWNLLIDVVAQTGRYPNASTGIDQFYVDGQTRVWVHVAIDRFTGKILDERVESVSP